MDANLNPANIDPNNEPLSLPSTWFGPRVTFEQIRHCFSSAKTEIRIASGFFTIKGWGLIRRHTTGKHVYLLVGIDDPGEERARQALINEIMRELRTGLDRERRQAVSDLVQKMKISEFSIFDGRAMAHHAKLYLVDREVAIITSANTTGRGFLHQIESGTLQDDPQKVNTLVNRFDEYFAQAKDITEKLLEALEKWLQLASPWDVYLKTMLALEQVNPVKTSYKKVPVSYQQDMVAETLRQIRDYGGSMLVASTGLGKTIVGVHVAIHLQAEDRIDKAIIICPNAVQSIWKREMREASIYADYFNLETLDRESSKGAHDLEDWEEISRTIDLHRWLLIFDESHKLRKRYPDEYKNKRYKQEDKRERKAFTRIKELVKSGNVKVLLLTGSPYATDIDNINTQLLLLPHTDVSHALLSEEWIDGAQAWRINEAEEFTKLPVTSQLTTPHVAKYYGQTDTFGVYIDFNGEKKYIPHVVLHSVYVPLPFENELTSAISSGYLNLESSIYKKNIETLVKTAWGSSPLALRSILERVVDTPGGLKEFNFARNQTSEFRFSRLERQQVLNPVIEKLKKLTFAQDLKLQTLIRILKTDCQNEKVIVFCERHQTAFYLEQALNQLLPSLRVFSTIEKLPTSKTRIDEEYESKNTRDIELAIAKFAPVANNAVGKYKETYDVFIATDAYGIGVSMQDASAVVNYDIAWTPIEPVQRAGRILRLWNSHRTIQVYTFVPTLTEQTAIRYELLKLKQRWENLMERHGESQKLIDLPVLTVSVIQEIYMQDVAPQKVLVESGNLKLDTADDKYVSPYYKHMAQLQQHREYAEKISPDIISAKTYDGQIPQMYVLVKYNEEYYVLLYEPKAKTVRSPEPEEILDLVKCNEDTVVAWVETDLVEGLSDDCIRAWCIQNSVEEQEVVRECALYLKPETEGDKDWLNF